LTPFDNRRWLRQAASVTILAHRMVIKKCDLSGSITLRIINNERDAEKLYVLVDDP
jgi:hypothetical protein